MDFIKAHWRPLAILGTLLVAFAAGKYGCPRTVTVTKTETQWKDRIVTQVVEKQAEQKTVTQVVYRDVVTHKDGTTETKEEVKTGEQDDTLKDTTTHREDTSQGTTATQTTVTKGSDAPKWFVSAGLGIPVTLRAPFVGAPFVLVDVSHKILGPISAGIWGSSDLNRFNPAVGFELGISF